MGGRRKVERTLMRELRNCPQVCHWPQMANKSPGALAPSLQVVSKLRLGIGQVAEAIIAGEQYAASSV